MKLSVVIINHNMCEVLRHTLSSLVDAGKSIDYEVFIYDNASADSSVKMIENEFPQFHIIASQKQVGYAKAYNEMINLTTGQYILLVNPDIISSKKTLERALEFMDEHVDSGAVGVRMITPKGSFMPESNRGLSSQWITFFKLTGLSKYFPKTYIINFNWVNTPKLNWQFVKNFYGAMIIFAVKYLFKMPEIKLDGTGQLPLAYEVER